MIPAPSVSGYIDFIYWQWRIIVRTRERFLLPLGFFILVMTLFPLAINPEKQSLMNMAPAILLMTVLLSSVLSLEHLFKDDYESGVLYQLYLSGYSFIVIVFIKTLFHWLALTIMLTIAACIFSGMLGLPLNVIDDVAVTILLSTFCTTFIGAMTSALTLNVEKSSVLLQLIVLPLLVPILIFSAGIIQFALLNQPNEGLIALCVAYALISAVISPIISAIIIRWQFD